MRLPRVIHRRFDCLRLLSLVVARIGHNSSTILLPARLISSTFQRSRNEDAVQGEPRSVIKLHVSEEELKRALRAPDAAVQHVHSSAVPSAPDLFSPTSSRPSVHPTVASHSREDVLSAEPDALRALADAGHPFAQHYVGVLLMTGSEGQPLDRTLAARYLHLSTQHEQRDVEPLSLFFLAGLLEELSPMPHPPPASTLPPPVALYKQYCQRSQSASPFHSESLFRVARLLLHTGREHERTEAEEWMERAARAGHVRAMLQVAEQRLHSASRRETMEAGRQAATKDEQEAREWMQRARDSLQQQLENEAHSGRRGHPPRSTMQASNQQQSGSHTAGRIPSKKKRRR